ncbi:MAG: alpha/beta hydrolase [Kordiimonadaceae bacterium]|nr:alpha/beta hydrolase [Kordiimonadaceae bacterium]MBO6569624.1 alpha/beta hydrolase [Kordiimonadaceae bacterium]MBO6966159.1 alpha/beta hydrolase [Kordiimonadaceae bacterium]
MSEEKLPTSAMLAEAKERRREAPDDAIFSYYTATDGVQMRFARFPASKVVETKGTIVFLPGRTEFIEKFLEDIHLWNDMGFACAAMDLRGQGMSHRVHSNRDKHYVDTFDQHIDDVHQFFEEALVNKMPKPFILMGHSAGSHVIMRFLHDHPRDADAAILVAPMMRIAAGGIPRPITKGLAQLMTTIGLGAAYVPGHTKFKEGRWGWRRKLTHDDDRFEDEDHFITTRDKRLAVGGATYKWLLEAMKSCDTLMAPGYVESIQHPVLILQASEDQIVDNAAQSHVAALLPHGRLAPIEGAMHEILKESDDIRAKVWDAIGEFIDLKRGPDFSVL